MPPTVFGTAGEPVVQKTEYTTLNSVRRSGFVSFRLPRKQRVMMVVG
ncbi:MAG: hypothetical protein ACXW4Q_11085 [Anaerolineales bacterium]